MFFKSVSDGFNDLWRYLFTIGLVIVAYVIIGQIPLTISIWYAINNYDDVDSEVLETFMNNPDFSLLHLHSNLGFLILLSIFVFASLALWIGVKFIHQKKEAILVRSGAIQWKKIGFGFGFWLLLALIFEMVLYFQDPSNYVFSFNSGSFFVLLFISLLILPIQTSFEEFFFRSYLMKGFGLIFNNKWLPIIITSILFGAIHGFNPEIAQFGFFKMQAYYILAAIFLAVITVLDDGLELALGVHFATNFYGAVFVGYAGSAIQTDGLAKTLSVSVEMMIIGLVFFIIVFCFVCNKMYKWKHPKTLFEAINTNEVPEV